MRRSLLHAAAALPVLALLAGSPGASAEGTASGDGAAKDAVQASKAREDVSEAGVTEASTADVDLEAAQTIYKRVCRNCHGPEAQGMASFPMLADKEPDYIVMRLEQYRAGEKVGANTGLMKGFAQDLSDEEIAGLAAYISTSFE